MNTQHANGTRVSETILSRYGRHVEHPTAAARVALVPMRQEAAAPAQEQAIAPAPISQRPGDGRPSLGSLDLFEYVLHHVAPKFTRDLVLRLQQVESYEWADPKNEETARLCCEGAWTAAKTLEDNVLKCTRQGVFVPLSGEDSLADIDKKLIRNATEHLARLIEALLDLYDNDRAQRAGREIPERPLPIRIDGIPEKLRDTSFTYRERKMKRLSSWSTKVPHDQFRSVARAVALSHPDEFFLVKYKRLADPLIYARYGAWYVKLAEWE
jgi:hypothetical protein